MYNKSFFQVTKSAIVFVMLFFTFSSMMAQTFSQTEKELYDKAIQLWNNGYDSYSKGDYQKAYTLFKECVDLNAYKLMSCDKSAYDAMNHCLYLLGREDEIDDSHTCNNGKYYLELDTASFVTEKFQKLWRALDERDGEQVWIITSDILKCDTVNGLQDRYTHARKLEYVGNQCHWKGMYEDATYYLHPALELERNLTPPTFRYKLYPLVEKLVDSYLKSEMVDSACSVALKHYEECKNNPSDTVLAKGYSNAQNLIIHIMLSLGYFDEAWKRIEGVDSVINTRFHMNNHLYGTTWKIKYFQTIGRKDKALATAKKLVEISKLFDKQGGFITADIYSRIVETLTGINDYENAIPLQQRIIDISDSLKFLNVYGEQYLKMAEFCLNNHDYDKSKYWVIKTDSLLKTYDDYIYRHNDSYKKMLSLQSVLATISNDDDLYNASINEIESFISSDSLKNKSFEPKLCEIKGIHEVMNKNWDEAEKLFLKQLEYPNINYANALVNLAQCFILHGKPDSAYNYIKYVMEDSIQQYVKHNLESLSSREREFFWDWNSGPFNILCHSIIESGKEELTGQLYDNIALFSKGLLLTASSSPNYLRDLQITWRDIQQKLNKSEAAIEFIATPHDDADSAIYVALILRNDSELPKMVRLAKGGQIKAAMAKGLSTTALSDIIWKPLNGELKDVNTVWFSADGILHKVPIEYVPYKNKKDISDIYDLHRLTSTRELVIHRQTIREENAVLYGDLTYTPSSSEESSTEDFEGDLVRSASRKPLLYTQDEIRNVSDVLKGKGVECKIYNNGQGTRSSLLSLNRQPISFLHLATHGYYYEADSIQNSESFLPSLFRASMTQMSQAEKAMLRSGLIMSDSILTAYDVSHLSFKDLRLVTLSACGSGLGDIGKGEGVFGLQRAFKQAGAQSIMMTLWDVDDYMTYRFMEHFYKKVSSGYSMQKALKSAQKMVRNTKIEGKYCYRDPSYWAGYVLLDAFN